MRCYEGVWTHTQTRTQPHDASRVRTLCHPFCGPSALRGPCAPQPHVSQAPRLGRTVGADAETALPLRRVWATESRQRQTRWGRAAPRRTAPSAAGPEKAPREGGGGVPSSPSANGDIPGRPRGVARCRVSLLEPSSTSCAPQSVPHPLSLTITESTSRHRRTKRTSTSAQGA